MRTVFALALCVLASLSLSAQTGVPASYVLRVYAQGSTTPTTTLSVPVSQISCNQATVPGVGGVENPSAWRWTDPAAPGRDCVYQDTARFAALPDGAYEGTISAVNAAGSSAETARIPFTRARPNPPAVPTGARITQ